MSAKARPDGPSWRLWRGSVTVWAALMAFLGLTLWLAYVPLDGWNGTVSYAIAGAKALLVILVFMRLSKSPAILVLAALAGIFWLGILFSLTFTDYPFRQDGERLRTLPPERADSAADSGPD